MSVQPGETDNLASENAALRKRVAELQAELQDAYGRQATLIASERKHRQLIENTHDIIYTLSSEGVFRFVSPAWTRMLGHSLDDVVGHPFTEFVHPEDRSTCFAFLQAVTQIGERRAGVEYRVQHADGSWRWHTSNASPTKDDSGNVTRYDGIARDITERKRAEEGLRRSEANLQAIMANTSDLIASYDRDRRLVVYNQACSEAFRQMFGAELRPGFRTLDIVPEAMRSMWNANNERVLAGESFTSEFELPLATGDLRVYESSYHPIRQGTDVVGFTTTTRDITERFRAAKALRASESQLRTITDATQDAIIMLDSSGSVTFWNPAAVSMLGYSSEEAIGRNAHELLAPATSAAAHRGAFQKFVRSGTGDFVGKTVELVACRKDGTEITLSLSLSAILLDGHWHAVGILRDITEQKRAEAALAESEARFRAMVNLAPDGIFIASLDGCIMEASEFAASQIGVSRDKLLTMRLTDFVSPRYAARVTNLRGEGDHPIVRESAHVRADGTEIPIELSIRRITFRGQPAMLGVARDVTERRRAELEQEKLQNQLLQAHKMESVGRLAGGVAHDFNNMLGVILGHTQMALDQLDPAHPLCADLKEVYRAAERSAELTRQLLAFARRQTVAPKVLDLNETVYGMLKMLRRLIGEDVELTWLPGQSIARVRIDPSQVDQILANLCVNARDAIVGTGRLTIETSLVTLDDEYCALHEGSVSGQYVMLAVSDNGCGMDANTLNHVFEPFFTTKEVGKGTGLGLATVFGIVRQNRGFIEAYSEPGHGTTFKIYLPAVHSERDVPCPLPSASPVPGTETVLLVEDERAMRQVTTRMLQRLGYRVVAASTPGEAIQLAREHAGPIDILLTDVVMPEMNGRDLAKNLLSLYPSLKRLFMSGYTADVIAHHGVLDEGVNFLQKPFSSDVLGAKLREVLQRE
jgi:PAS domain S-box-containing protein